MRIILLEDVENLGRKGEIQEVKDGYAINFLIPKGLAKMATQKEIEKLNAQKREEEKKAEKELQETQSLVIKLDGQEVTFSVKVNKEGGLFGSITARKICSKLKEMGFEVKQDQIQLPKPIKEVGEFPVSIDFPHNLEAEITVIVTEVE